MLRAFEPVLLLVLPPPTRVTPVSASSRDMDSSDESVASSSDESDVQSDVSDEQVYDTLTTEDAGDCIDEELKRMDQLVSDLTAERDRINRASGIQRQANTSVDRNAEFVKRANKQMEEANNVLSGVWMTAGPMDQLSHDCVAHIMQFIPIQQVYVCMSVNKKWEEAARHSIRVRKRVQLVSRDNWGRLEKQIQNPLNLIVENVRNNERKLRQMGKSLLLMGNLKHLQVNGCYNIRTEVHQCPHRE